jgi:phosphoglycolate phosphatase-like HAD superfamily hydrolase
VDEIYRTQLGRSARDHEVEAIRNLFVQKLRRAIVSSPRSFAAVSGAGKFIDRLIAEGVAVSLASGGWRDSALLKLATAELRLDALPAAFADDAPARVDIMTTSYRRACTAQGVAEFDDVVYVGDGRWDAKASRFLNYKFIGVGVGEKAQQLVEWGAVDTLNDFADTTRAMEKIAFAFGRWQKPGRI